MIHRALARQASNGLNGLGHTLLQASYGKRGRAARDALMVLETFELHLRSGYAEPFKGGEKLTIEHVLPQKWTEHWPLEHGDPERADRRNALMHTLGNLTLTTDKLNAAMSNQAWDEKHIRLCGHSTLTLNEELLREAGLVWNVEAIEERAGRMAEWAESLWPIPLK